MTPAARSKYNRAYYAAHVEARRVYQEEYRKRNRDRLNAVRRAKYSLDEEYRSKEKERKKVKRPEDMDMAEIVAHRALFQAVTSPRIMRMVDDANEKRRVSEARSREKKRCKE